MNNLRMIVIDKTALDKMCVLYTTDVKDTGFIEAVEEAFEDIGIPVDTDEVDSLAHDLFKNGFANWEDLHFEILM